MESVPTTGNIILLVACVLFLAWQVFHGWRQGIMRQLVGLVAFAASYLVAWLAGELLVPLLRPLGWPDLLLRALSGLILGVITFVAVSGLGAILFKRTEHQSISLVRWSYGLAGAVIGLLFGIFGIWLALVAVRFVGNIAEFQVQNATQDGPPTAMAARLAGLKHSMDDSIAGPLMAKADPVPNKVHVVISKMLQVFASPARAQKFLEFPEVKPLAKHPRILALQKDPVIAHEISAGRYFGLMSNKSIVDAANDADLGKKLRALDIEKALDYALAPDAR